MSAELIDEFAFLDDWEARYMHVIELGKALAPLTDAERVPANKVEGCTSQVWLVAERDGDHLIFRGDSDAQIVRGLIAVVIRMFSGRRAAEIVQLDAAGVLGQLGLENHLTPQRANGLHAMVSRMQAVARAASA